jgi:AcrR family transcriptional regulator
MKGSVAVRSAEGEREALLRAMAQVVGEKGYRRTSVAEVIADAESCRESFDRHFADKQECFFAAQERLFETTLEVVSEEIDEELPWAERIREALRLVLGLCRERPGLARAALVEAAPAGAAGRRCYLAGIERFAELVAPEAELATLLPPRAALLAVSGVAGLIGEELARGAEGLETLLPELIFALFVPLLGPAAAGEQMSRLAAEARG